MNWWVPFAFLAWFVTGAIAWDAIVRWWRRYQATSQQRAIESLAPDAKIKFALKSIYDLLERVDRNKLLQVTILNKDQWNLIHSSNTLQIFARTDNPNIMWHVDEAVAKSALISMRVRGLEGGGEVVTSQPSETPIQDR